MNWRVPLFETYSDSSDVQRVSEVIERGTYWATGPEIDDFEASLEEYLGADYALAFNSGTSALEVLLAAYGIEGGEVIVPSFTFVATANTVLLSGARPVFADIEEDTFGLNPDDVKERITADTEAIMPMHYGGSVCRGIKELRDIADEEDLLLIEDAAESLGSTLEGVPAGTFGDAAMFSLCQNKLVSTGEGGILVTDDEEAYERSRLLRSHGRVQSREGDYFSSVKDTDYAVPGHNYRMSSISAALGCSQMEKIDDLIEMRQERAAKLNKALSRYGAIKTPQFPQGTHVYQMYTILLDSQDTRDNLQEFLKEKGIMSKIYFNPVHEKRLYQDQEVELPVTGFVSDRVLTLPMYPHLSQEDIDYMIETIHEFFAE